MKPLFPVLGVMMICVLLSGPADAQSTRGPAAQPGITFSGGPGDTVETAVIIAGAASALDGIAAEYRYLNQQFGRENRDWMLARQSVLQQKGKVYDRMELDLKDRSKKVVFFDITAFFGKL